MYYVSINQFRIKTWSLIQNSIRVAQWILKDDKSAAYFGCVGEDADGEILAKVASESGVAVAYQKSKEVPTGRCAVLITDQNRYTPFFLDRHPLNGGV